MNKRYDYLEFLELHAGPEYCIYYKCANTNMMVFITLIFGPALPVLYIISLISIFCQYIIERLTLAYFYRIPPKFSDKLTLLNIKIMQWAPIPSLMFTFWLYGNKQMFDNKIDVIKTQGELTLSHHTFQEMHNSKHDINSSESALIYTMILIAIYLLLDKLYYIYHKYVTERTIDS